MSGVAAPRIAVVGVSIQPTCGVRDHATLLARGLEDAGVRCSLHWLQRDAGSLRGALAQHREWVRTLRGELDRERPDAVLLHYSVFALSHRGLPVLVRPTLAALRRGKVATPAAGEFRSARSWRGHARQRTLIVVGHELAYPWRRRDLRGNLWASTQRVALAALVRSASSVLVTTDFRLRWLARRRWLPRRPLALAPVFSNLPPPSPDWDGEVEADVVGLFGYRYDEEAIALVLDALALLRERVPAARLRLLGAPGASSTSGQAWLAAARARAIEPALSFTGPLPAQQLSDALAGCTALLFADVPGPTSRKGTLAGSLASGRPLVAVDGHRRWDELLRAGAVRLVEPQARAVADALAELLADEHAREQLGARGRAFAQERMGLARTVEAVRGLLEAAVVGETPLAAAQVGDPLTTSGGTPG